MSLKKLRIQFPRQCESSVFNFFCISWYIYIYINWSCLKNQLKGKRTYEKRSLFTMPFTTHHIWRTKTAVIFYAVSAINVESNDLLIWWPLFWRTGLYRHPLASDSIKSYRLNQFLIAQPSSNFIIFLSAI